MRYQKSITNLICNIIKGENRDLSTIMRTLPHWTYFIHQIIPCTPNRKLESRIKRDVGITFLAATVATATRILGTIFSFNWIHNDPTVTNSHRCFLQDLFRGDGVDIFELSLLLGPIFSNRKAHLLTNGCLFRWITLFRSQTCKFPPKDKIRDSKGCG